MEQEINNLVVIGKAELKDLIQETLQEILKEIKEFPSKSLSDILDIQQAAEFLKKKITTLYEMTSKKTIPHFKKGNKLYFKREELEQWLSEGKVKPVQHVQQDAITYSMNNKKRKTMW